MTTTAEQKKKVDSTKRSLSRGRKRKDRLRRRVRHVTARNQRRQARLQRQRLKLKRLREESHSAKAAADWGLRLAERGCVESPAYSNKGPHITEWQVNSGYSYVANAREGVPWCQCFANAFMVQAGLPQLKTGYTVTVVEYARASQHDLKLVFDRHHGGRTLPPLKIGDLIYYDWSMGSGDICDHVGVYVGDGRVLEGNTSPGNSGSQNNGGGLYVRRLSTADRNPSLVSHVVRPNYN